MDWKTISCRTEWSLFRFIARNTHKLHFYNELCHKATIVTFQPQRDKGIGREGGGWYGRVDRQSRVIPPVRTV